jgi:hypothetical protein
MPSHPFVDSGSWTALPHVDQILAVVADLQTNTGPGALMPDDGINPGRAMRCLMMSYLC